MKIRFPGVKILDRYIMGKFLGTYFFTITLMIILLVVFDAVEKIDDFIELKAPLKSIAIDYYLNFIPFFINQFSGLLTFIAVIFFTSKMAYQTEIIAILSSGTSFRRLMWPYFLSALIIGVLSLFLNLNVIPSANVKRVDFENQFLRRKLNAKFDKNIYRQVYPGTFAYIRGYNKTTETAMFLALENYDDGKIVSSLEASKASFNDKTDKWSAPKYVERTFDGENETFEVKENLDTMINLNTQELGRLEQLIQTLNRAELNEFIEQQKMKGSDMIAMFEVERHRRYAYPFSTFILTLIGVSLSSRKVRGGTGLHIGVGIGLCFSYILFARFTEEFAKGGIMSAALSVWIPNIVYTLIAIYLYKKAPK